MHKRKVRKQASSWSVSLAGQALITTVQGIFSTAVLFSVEVYALRMELSVLPHICECSLHMQVLLKVLPFTSSAPQQGWLSGCLVSIHISGMNVHHLIPGCEARNYSSLASSRLEKCNPFSLEANPLDLASLNNMLPSLKISFLSPSLTKLKFLGKKKNLF